ncbi:MAG: protein-L-isoaspartate O-methyltransferase [Alphaproteobacteria bacterium]|nr:protein-L-isoaspartate O-methyltransferase [Alphaproteobacteria bacterium]
MVDAVEQRHNMVESQIRPSDITDRRIIRAMQSVAREKFVPESVRSLAYQDGALALPTKHGGAKRAEHAPRVLAKLIQEANIKEHDVILDIGAATGYSSALLAQIGETVLALEEDELLAERATATLSDLSIDNVAVVTGPLIAGYPKAGPYDAIILEGAITAAPDHLFPQLKDAGRLVAVVQSNGSGQAMCWQRSGDTIFKRVCFDATATVLPGFEPVAEFSL